MYHNHIRATEGIMWRCGSNYGSLSSEDKKNYDCDLFSNYLRVYRQIQI